MVDTSVENDVLLSNAKVYGMIYKMQNNINTQCYIGQTVSHRKNKGKWRPFGIQGRFNDQYIYKKGKAVYVCVDKISASFNSKKDTLEQKKEKAKAFLKEIHDATLSNCGKPVKPE
jgi:hypothetical protein